MKLTDKEIESVIRLNSEKRFEYAIKRIADNESLYSAKFSDGDYAIFITTIRIFSRFGRLVNIVKGVLT